MKLARVKPNNACCRMASKAHLMDYLVFTNLAISGTDMCVFFCIYKGSNNRGIITSHGLLLLILGPAPYLYYTSWIVVQQTETMLYMMMSPFCWAFTKTGTHIWHNFSSLDANPFCWMFIIYTKQHNGTHATGTIMFRYKYSLLGIKEHHGLEFLTEDSQNQDQHEANWALGLEQCTHTWAKANEARAYDKMYVQNCLSFMWRGHRS